MDRERLDEVNGLRIRDASLACLQVAHVAEDKDVAVALGLQGLGLLDKPVAVQEMRGHKRAVGGAAGGGDVRLRGERLGRAARAGQGQHRVAVGRALHGGDCGVGNQLDVELLQLRPGLPADAFEDGRREGQPVAVDEVHLLSALLGVLEAQLAGGLGAGLATADDDDGLGAADLVAELAHTLLGLFGRTQALPRHVVLGRSAGGNDEGMVVDGAAGARAERNGDGVAGGIHGAGGAEDKLELIGGIFLEKGPEIDHGLVVGQLAGHDDSGHGNGPVKVGVWGNDDHVVFLVLENHVAHGLADKRRGSHANAQDNNRLHAPIP
ncbi:hypothetical protein Trco_005507 [Trichoderma cornu-damae]|uniref:Uncharacterized protein n=1 Tax=Trichoderma cornu-damae TaxID=654480 RepID=A0A9P8TWJ2_9HYPO|nr:hypothetical protein Trco_005507 [Trichoderma cornu-damae]